MSCRVCEILSKFDANHATVNDELALASLLQGGFNELNMG
jgi:hypothetical protein